MLGGTFPKIVSIDTGVLFKKEVWVTITKCIISMYEMPNSKNEKNVRKKRRNKMSEKWKNEQEIRIKLN